MLWCQCWSAHTGLIFSSASNSTNQFAPTESRIHFLADVPHLKNLRSAFVKHKKLLLPTSIVSMNDLLSAVVVIGHVIDVLTFKQDKTLKLATKLTASVLEPSHFQKIYVGLAMNLFSRSVSAALRFLVEREERPVCYKTTGWFIDAFNHW